MQRFLEDAQKREAIDPEKLTQRGLAYMDLCYRTSAEVSCAIDMRVIEAETLTCMSNEAETRQVALMEEKIANHAEAALVTNDAEDMGSDPFSMMTGMGEEKVYKVTLMEEQLISHAEAAAAEDDPFSMMAGMGEEVEYKVTLMEQANVGTTEGYIERCPEEVPAIGATKGHHADGEDSSCSEVAAATPS